MNDFVIYRISFPDGRFYIGKTKNLHKRKLAHISKSIKGDTLKDSVLFASPYRFEIIDSAPPQLSPIKKQKWIDDKEKYYIHAFARKVYNEATNSDSDYESYSQFKEIVNRKMVNMILY